VTQHGVMNVSCNSPPNLPANFYSQQVNQARWDVDATVVIEA